MRQEFQLTLIFNSIYILIKVPKRMSKVDVGDPWGKGWDREGEGCPRRGLQIAYWGHQGRREVH